MEQVADTRIIHQRNLCDLCQRVKIPDLFGPPLHHRRLIGSSESSCWLCSVVLRALSQLDDWPDGYIGHNLSELEGSANSPNSQLIAYAWVC
jgi:hypothetical protein